MNRFYNAVTVHTVDGGFSITLDERILKTPAQNPFVIPTRPLAEMIAQEWDRQGKTIKPETMPLQGLAVTAIDKGDDTARFDIMNEISRYIDGDLLFYHAPDPAGLVKLQTQCWGDLITLAQDHFQHPLRITYDLGAITQSPAYHQAIIAAITSLNMWQFTTFHNLVATTGSPLLSILGVLGKIDCTEALKAVFLEDDYYAALYGETEDTIPTDQKQKRRQTIADISACFHFLKLCRD